MDAPTLEEIHAQFDLFMTMGYMRDVFFLFWAVPYSIYLKGTLNPKPLNPFRGAFHSLSTSGALQAVDVSLPLGSLCGV